MADGAVPAVKAADAPVKAPSSSSAPASLGSTAAPTPVASTRAPSAVGSLGDRQVRAKAAPDAPRVGAADDPAEKAADVAADRVMRTAEKDAREVPPAPDAARNPVIEPPAPPPSADTSVRRSPAAPADRRHDLGSRNLVDPLATAPSDGAASAPADLQAYLDASRGTGEPLPDDTRAEFESSFGRSLAQ